MKNLALSPVTSLMEISEMNVFYGVIKSYLDEFFVGIVHDIIFLFFKTITAVKNNIMYTQ